MKIDRIIGALSNNHHKAALPYANAYIDVLGFEASGMRTAVCFVESV